jgi:Fe-S cluster assembly ATPase SufC
MSTAPLFAVQPDRMHVIGDGRVVPSGGPELSTRLDAEGDERFGGGA